MIKIICLGKLKEKYLVDALEEYKKRISKYSKLEIIELNDLENLGKERDLILSKLNTKDYIITLDIEGNELTSEEFSKKIEKTFIENSNITFIIGSSNGLHQDIKNLSKFSLSFSKMTFPHQLFRVILLEQIYRSFKIINNESYHK